MKINHNANTTPTPATDATDKTDNSLFDNQRITKQVSASSHRFSLPQEMPPSPPLKRYRSIAVQTESLLKRCPLHGIIKNLAHQPSTATESHGSQPKCTQRLRTPSIQTQPANAFSTKSRTIRKPLNRLFLANVFPTRTTENSLPIRCRTEAAYSCISIQDKTQLTQMSPFNTIANMGGRIITDQSQIMGISCQHPTSNSVENYLELLWYTQSPLVVILTSERELVNGPQGFSAYFREDGQYGPFEVVSSSIDSLTLGNCQCAEDDDITCYADQYLISLMRTDERGCKQFHHVDVVHVLDWGENDYLEYQALDELVTVIREMCTQNTEENNGRPILVNLPNNSRREGVFYAAQQLESDAYLGRDREIGDIIKSLNQGAPNLISNQHQISQLLNQKMFYEKTRQASLEHEPRLRTLADSLNIQA